jgi:hypothetical protein
MDSHPDTPQWSAARLAAVAPAWEPDPVRGRALMRRRPAPARPRRMTYLTAAATAALLVAFVSPSGRALAQDLWYRWFVTRMAIVRLDLSKIPLDTHIETSGYRGVGSIAEAAREAGFTPSLPSPDVAGGQPALSIMSTFTLTQRISTRDLDAALRREGATDVEVPAEWDGTRLRGVVGPIVVAAYPGGLEVTQTAPIRLEMPAGFPLQRFAEVAFRSAGLPWWEARKLSEEYAAQPAWLLDVPANAAVSVETVSLAGGGSATLIEDPDESPDERVTVIISRPTRLYAISSPTRELSLRVANAVR